MGNGSKASQERRKADEAAQAAERQAKQVVATTEILDLICPIAILAITASSSQPDASEVLWKTQAHISGGSYGRISVGPIPKAQLHPSLTTESGRVSRYDGDNELVTFKSPYNLPVWEPKAKHSGQGPPNVVKFIPFKDMLPELAFLSAPDLLYHENIVDLLGYFWEPHEYGGSGSIGHAPILILEFADQGSLSVFFSSITTITIPAKLGLCIDICRALQTLHHELKLYGDEDIDKKPFGLYHGDLKPGNILVFSKPSTTGWAAVSRSVGSKPEISISPIDSAYTAKLCDLGSCVRYDPKVPSKLGDLGLGTEGWKAPELVHEVKSRKGKSSEVPIDPLKAEIFAFGLLIAYVILEKELFRLPLVAEFLVHNYFGHVETPVSFRNAEEIMLTTERSHLPTLQAAQQWMIGDHLEVFVVGIQQSIVALGLPQENAQAILDVLDITLRKDPNDRISSFRDVCIKLGGDPDESRKRTPIKPVINTFAAKDIHMTVQGAISSITLTTSMPYQFRIWLGAHLEQVFDHVNTFKTKNHQHIAGQIALLRGLLSFIPPEVTLKSDHGLEWLKKAVDLDIPQALPIYTRLAAYQNFNLERDWASQLQDLAKSGSLFSREDLIEAKIPLDTVLEPDASLEAERIIQNFKSYLIWPLHNIAFMDKEDEIKLIVENGLKQNWELEAQCLVGPEQVTAGSLNYAMSQPGTVLHWSVAMNNLSAIKVLVEAGASPYTKNIGGNTPWGLAVGSRLLPIIQLFAESCTCKDEIDRNNSTKQGIYSSSPSVYLACGRHFVQQSLDLFHYLWKIGALTRQDAYNSTASMGAASPELLELLLESDYSSSPDENLLREVLLHAIHFTDRKSVPSILHRLPRFDTGDYTLFLLCMAIRSDEAASFDVFLKLLNHLSPDFNINVRFTYRYATETKMPTISTSDGVTLLHYAFSRGKTAIAIELLKRGADPSIVSLDSDSEASGITPLGHLLFPQTNHNYLALYNFLKSQYLKDNPTFILENSVLNPDRNQNILHILCSGEDERVHNSVPHKTSALYELLAHLKSLEQTAVGAKERVVELVNARSGNQVGEDMTPLLLALTSGFSQAIRHLIDTGAKIPECEGRGDTTELPDLSFLQVIQKARRVEEWEKQFKHKSQMLRSKGYPWIEIDSPVAKNMRFGYEKRTKDCLDELKKVS